MFQVTCCEKTVKYVKKKKGKNMFYNFSESITFRASKVNKNLACFTVSGNLTTLRATTALS